MIYELGHIYVIWDIKDHNLVYYGSTKNLEDRIKEHKKMRRNACTSKKIIERGNYEYAILESHENIDEYDLVERERWYILNKVCVNKKVPHRTRAEWYQNNKEKMAKHMKEYNQNNKEKFAKQKKEYYQNNKDKYSQINKQKVRCPHCDKELSKSYLTSHIKKFCKEQITHQP